MDTMHELSTTSLAPWAALREWLEAGGPVMYVLAGLSTLAMAIVLAKSLQFLALRYRLWPRVTRAALLARARNRNAFEESLSVLPGAIAEVLALAERCRYQEDDTDMIECRARGIVEGLRSGLPLLGLIASLCPLLGLFGTVLGMIDAFQALETSGAQADPAALSGGIWIALLTTAAGLAVAIPAATAHHLLEAEVGRQTHRLEDLITSLLSKNGASPAVPERRVAQGILQPAE